MNEKSRRMSMRSQERSWKYRRKIIVALETKDHIWGEAEMQKLQDEWEKGRSVREIAEIFKKDETEIVIGLAELKEQKRIKFVEFGELKKRGETKT